MNDLAKLKNDELLRDTILAYERGKLYRIHGDTMRQFDLHCEEIIRRMSLADKTLAHSKEGQ